MTSRKERLANFKLYAATDLKDCSDAIFEKIENMLQGGVDIIQLRSKVLTDRELFLMGRQIKEICLRHEKLFFVNDRPDLCVALDADGVHIGQDDLPVNEVRKIVSSKRLIGKSTHSFEQAKNTLVEDVDYIGSGPVFGTPTKPTYEPVGLSLIGEVNRIATKPVVCIGGISLENVDSVLDAGAERIAVVRALFDSENPLEVANTFKAKLENNVLI